MGARGPKPLPANVHLLKNNPSKISASSFKDVLQPEIEIPGCPPHFFKEAKKEWKRIVPELKRYGLISKLDRAVLSLYCQSWAQLVFAESRLNRDMKLAEERRAEAEDKGEDYVGGDGMVTITTNGNMTSSPYWVMANRAREQVDKFLANFGLSPSARGRVNQSNFLQGSLSLEEPADGEPATSFNNI